MADQPTDRRAALAALAEADAPQLLIEALKDVKRLLAENQRLLAEVERLRLMIQGFELGGHVSFGNCSEEVQQRLAENRRLREALRAIATGRDASGLKVDFFQDIAREALGDA